MSKAPIDVRYVAKLARLDLTDAEASLFQSQLSAILGHVESLSAIEMPDELLRFDSSQLGFMRQDKSAQSLCSESVLRNAPDQAQGQIRVPKVVADA